MDDYFLKALDNLLEIEGGYAFDKDDAGGETFKGISRIYHPSWSGWSLVDELISVGTLSRDQHKSLLRTVRAFYYEHYWLRINGYNLACISFKAASFILSWAVNKNVTRAVGDFQKSLNKCNRNEMLYRDILVDGFLGPVTLTALEKCMHGKTNRTVLPIFMFHYRNRFYVDKMDKYPSQEKWIGWMLRDVPNEVREALTL